MNKLLEAVKEASISVACLLDDIAVDENNDIKIFELQKDIEHLQDQITIIENELDERYSFWRATWQMLDM